MHFQAAPIPKECFSKHSQYQWIGLSWVCLHSIKLLSMAYGLWPMGHEIEVYLLSWPNNPYFKSP